MSDKDYKGKKGVDGDDYKPLKFYQEKVSGVENGFETFSENDEYFFTYNLDGEVVLISEGYTSEKGRDNGVASVEKNRVIEKRYKRDSLDSGRHFFNLVAGNHQEIATSAWFSSEASMEAAIARLLGTGALPLAGIVGSTIAASTAESVEAVKAVSPTPEVETPQSSEPIPAMSTNQPAVDEEKKDCGCRWTWWLLPILLAMLVWYLFSQCCSRTDEASRAVTPSAVDASIEPATAINSTQQVTSDLGSFFSSKLPSGTDLNIPEFGIENKLITFIRDDSKPVDKTTWFNFDRINFATGKSELTLDSREQIRNIAEILKAYPQVKLKIGGYTDNTGSLALNQTLSENRAKSVKNSLISQGIPQDRLESEGYGPQHPVASNDTEEGRAQNRRIALRVTEK